MRSFGSVVDCLIDSSVLFKIFVEEPGTQNSFLILNGIRRPVISALTRIEMQSALRRASQRHQISSLLITRLGVQIEELCDAMINIPVNEDVQKNAIELMKSHKKLRTLDAVQLATAISAGCHCLATADNELARISVKEGFNVLNPLRTHKRL